MYLGHKHLQTNISNFDLSWLSIEGGVHDARFVPIFAHNLPYIYERFINCCKHYSKIIHGGDTRHSFCTWNGTCLHFSENLDNPHLTSLDMAFFNVHILCHANKWAFYKTIRNRWRSMLQRMESCPHLLWF